MPSRVTFFFETKQNKKKNVSKGSLEFVLIG